ncbi:hypothetical protein LMG9964_04869 [Paraburkholderia phenoliruptrix]|uniref:Uncharacterized protein n=1 Tax=Paraburkholderia phenoliruptrix TaxID=252970 RepID=A0A6J5KBF0_9BURK|nr:hypothetical protein LMG9964_04869 [Paraburkholderia phenoliruptrix]
MIAIKLRPIRLTVGVVILFAGLTVLAMHGTTFG